MPVLETQIALPSDQDASGRTLGQEEIDLLSEVISSGVLTSTKGRFVKTFENRFAAMIGSKHALACASGSAAVHAAIAALDPEPGDEIITSPITDMGALAPILYQSAIPVFAEVDRRTWNITAEAIAARISNRTRGILVTHLFGNPCDIGKIMQLADSRGIPVIEDCAQAFLAKHRDRIVGTIGAIGCFSLQQGKHITTGEGGVVITSDDALARRISLFINKGWGYGDPTPDHYFLALNYRMSELQGAVAVAQLPKLEWVVERRVRLARALSAELAGISGIEVPYIYPTNSHTYWKYCLRVDGRIIAGGAAALGADLKARQISCSPRYIQKPAFLCQIFQQQRTFGNSRFPFTIARPEALNYDPLAFPATMQALDEILVLPWNENYLEEHLNYIGSSIRQAVNELSQ